MRTSGKLNLLIKLVHFSCCWADGYIFFSHQNTLSHGYHSHGALSQELPRHPAFSLLRENTLKKGLRLPCKT